MHFWTGSVGFTVPGSAQFWIRETHVCTDGTVATAEVAAAPVLLLSSSLGESVSPDDLESAAAGSKPNLPVERLCGCAYSS